MKEKCDVWTQADVRQLRTKIAQKVKGSSMSKNSFSIKFKKESWDVENTWTQVGARQLTHQNCTKLKVLPWAKRFQLNVKERKVHEIKYFLLKLISYYEIDKASHSLWLPCHRWCSGRCWTWGGSGCCSPAAAARGGCGWCGPRTGCWRAAAPWGWSSAGAARRRTPPAPTRTRACSTGGSRPRGDLGAGGE